MDRIKLTPKYIAIGVVFLAAMDALLMLLGAVLIEKGVLAYSGAGVWGLVSLVLASVLACFICSSCSGLPLNGYVIVLFCFLPMIVLPMVSGSQGFSISMAVKEFTALISGAFLGNFFGITRHNKLRKIGKKKRSYTK